MRPTVLFVDDDETLTSALKRALKTEPYDIATASSAQEAMVILSQQRVDVVVADERMPGMTGTELLAIVREHHPEIMRIILTGYASLEATLHAINDGEVHRFLLKPYRTEELACVIREAIERKDLLENTMEVLHVLEHESKG